MDRFQYAEANVALSHDGLRTVLLRDSEDLVQAILPADRLLDLVSIKQETGKDLEIVGDAESLANQSKLNSVEAYPSLLNTHTLLDKSLETTDTAASSAPSDNVVIVPSVLQSALSEKNHHLMVVDMGASIPDIPLRQEAYETTPVDHEPAIRIAVENFTPLRVKQRLEETLEIPPLPQTARRILDLRSNPDSNISELAEVVETDPVLAAQIVSWASSPYYAIPGKIRSVQDAIVRVLGFDMVSNLALALAMGKTLAVPKDTARGVTAFWNQSIYCAVLVELLVKKIPAQLKPFKGISYLSGLLHNFGFLVMAHVFPNKFSLICRHIEANPHLSHMVIEQHLLQVSREQIGDWLMQSWSMPEELPIAIRHQHNPAFNDQHCAYPNLVFMALRLLSHHGKSDAPADTIPMEVYAKYGLCTEQLEEAVDQVLSMSEELDRMAGNFPS